MILLLQNKSEISLTHISKLILTGIKKQQEYLKRLMDVMKAPVYFTRNRRTESGDYRPGKRWEYGKVVPPLDHRTIYPLEVVMELDAKSYAQNLKYSTPIVSYSDSSKIPVYKFWSGNKSVHLHYFLSLENIKSKEIFEMVDKVIDHGGDIYQLIRMKFAKEILNECGLNTNLIGHGKVVDLAKLKWDGVGGKTSLIRCCGGANIKVDPDTYEMKTAWKTYYDVLPKNKPQPKVSTFDDVEYPKEIETYKISEGFVAEIVEEYFEKLTPQHKKELKAIDYDGKFMNVPCVQKLLEEGLKIGKRNVGAKILAIASRMDNLELPVTKEVLSRYVQSCPQLPQPFKQDEADMWADWIYSQPNPYWNCGHARSIGVCDDTDCPYNQEKFKDELSFFDGDYPLDKIKDALNAMVIGEESVKVVLFLLYLTKEFDPEWCIMLDGPAASGKSHVMKAVAQLFGEEGEEYFTYSRFTQASLNHMDVLAKKWAGKIVIIEELQGAKNVVEQLRVAISEGKLTLLEAQEVMNKGVKEHVTGAKEISFKDVLFVTCNAEEFDEGEQLKSRAWILNTDQTKDQTKQVMKHYLKSFNNITAKEVPNHREITAAIKVLKKPDRVVFPFAEELMDFMSYETVRGRRDVKKVISLIKSSAYFHQKNRYLVDIDGQRVLIADWRDAFITYKYGGDIINASSQGIGQRDLEFYELIVRQLTHVSSFQIDDVCKWCNISKSGAGKTMINLCEAGFFENIVKPPMKATYVKTKISPQYMGDVTGFCAEKAQNQEAKIDKWIQNNTKVYTEGEG